MPRRRFPALFVCVTLAIALSGCPLAGSMVGGPWQVNIDEMCDASVDLRVGMILDSGGSAQLYAGPTYMGTWELNGSTITINFSSPSVLTLSGALSMNGANMTNGSATGASTGCWTADRIEY